VKGKQKEGKRKKRGEKKTRRRKEEEKEPFAPARNGNTHEFLSRRPTQGGTRLQTAYRLRW
jgi:hypothetical protein